MKHKKKATGLSTEEKGKIISRIISELRFAAHQSKKPFDDGDTFLALCFKTDDELLKIAKLSGVA